MDWTAVEHQLPGAHRAQPLSHFAGLEAPAVARVLACRPAPEAHGSAPEAISLAGLWERAVDPELALMREVAFSVPTAGITWEPAGVPQNYGLEPALHTYFGPLWYRRSIRRPAGARWVDLDFAAVDYLADIVLDGEHLGRHEGYFAPFTLDLSERLPADRAVELLVRVQDPLEDLPDSGPLFLHHRKRWIKGTMNYHDSRPGGLPGEARARWTWPLGQSRPSGGIVGPVALRAGGPVRLEGLFVTPLDLDGGVHLALVLRNRTAAEIAATAVLCVTAPGGAAVPAVALDLALAPGANRVDLEGQIPDPQLWYDAALFELGRPALYELAATVVVDDAVSAVERTTFGLRTAEVETSPRWRYVLNGEEVFVRAANYIPSQHWALLGPDFYERDLRLLQQAHLHSVGLHAHVQSPACYEAADRIGVSIFQDLPLQWAYASGTKEDPSFISRATAMAAEMAYLLWNHPSVVYYAAHNEPFHVIAQQYRALLSSLPEEVADTAIREPQLSALLEDFSWMTDPEQDIGNYVLDLALEETLQQVDPTRHVHLASGAGDDIHEYSGTIGSGAVYDVGMTRAPFVSEYGSWPVDRTAVAHSEHWARPWPPQGKQRVNFWREGLIGSETAEMAGALERYPDLAAFAYATERKAAFVAKYQTEFFRIQRYRPYAGYRWHFFVNYWCRGGAGLLDVDRVPTLAYRALRAASRPRLVATTLEHTIFPPGTLTFPIYAANDSRLPWQAAVRWRVERLRAGEVIRAEPRAGTTVLNQIGGSYALPLPGALEVVAEGEMAGDVGVNETRALGEAGVSLGLPGPYRLVMGWEGEENDYTVYIAPAGWEAAYGLQVKSGVELRPGTGADLPSIARVFVDGWRSAYADFMPPSVLEELSYERAEAKLQQELFRPGSAGFAFVAVQDGEVAGFVAAGPYEDPTGDHDAEVYRLFVRQEVQGMGIGSWLLREAAAELGRRGYRRVAIWAFQESAAPAFYERLGGQVVQRRAMHLGGKDLEVLVYGWPVAELMSAARPAHRRQE